MKKIFILLAAVLMAAATQAQEQHLPRAYCGCTLGKTTLHEIYNDRSILQSETPFFYLSMTERSMVLTGDFVVEDAHFAILSLNFYKDTLYSMEFKEIELNADPWESNRAFIEKLRIKYQDVENFLDKEYTLDNAITVSKKDEKTFLMSSGFKHELEYKVNDIRLSDAELNEERASAYAFLKTGPNYDEKNKVESVAGVRFGETRMNTVNAFKSRGTYMDSAGDIVYFSDVNFGGSLFKVATLYFDYDSRKYNKVLAAVKFEKNFYEWRKDEAQMMYEAVVSRFKGKYTNCIVVKDEDNAKTVVCGMLDDNYAEGKIPPIIISLELGVSKGGDKFYYVSVSYFEMRMSSAASNDI